MCHQALRCHFDLSLGFPPDQGWRRCPGCPRSRWVGQLRRDNDTSPVDESSHMDTRGWRYGPCRLHVDDEWRWLGPHMGVRWELKNNWRIGTWMSAKILVHWKQCISPVMWVWYVKVVCIRCRHWSSWQKCYVTRVAQSWDRLFCRPLARCCAWLQVRFVCYQFCVYTCSYQ